MNKIKKKKFMRKGFNFAEILMATAALAILMLGFAQFSADVFNVSATHANQIKTVSQERLSSERIITQISKATYIYPSNINIVLSDGININTSNSIAMLIAKNNSEYTFIAYYLVANTNGKSDLYEYISNSTYQWNKDSCPATDLLNFSGTSSLISNDINTSTTTLNYILNYENASYDQSLKGEVSGVTTSDINALIRGINWKIYQGINHIEVIQLKGISKNVPRFIEE